MIFGNLCQRKHVLCSLFMVIAPDKTELRVYRALVFKGYKLGNVEYTGKAFCLLFFSPRRTKAMTLILINDMVC